MARWRRNWRLAKRQPFGAQLRDWRQSAGLSLRTLASATGMSATYISKIERQELPPPRERKLRKLARVLEVDVDEFLHAARFLLPELTDIVREAPFDYLHLLEPTKGLSREELAQIAGAVAVMAKRIKRQRRNTK